MLSDNSDRLIGKQANKRSEAIYCTLVQWRKSAFVLAPDEMRRVMTGRLVSPTALPRQRSVLVRSEEPPQMMRTVVGSDESLDSTETRDGVLSVAATLSSTLFI